MPDGESERVVVRCSPCGSVYAAERWPDGTLQPIGKRTGCQCGAGELQVIGGSEETLSETGNRSDC